jgi:hypothetical protein
MQRFVVYPGVDGQMIVADAATGKSETVDATSSLRASSKPIEVRSYRPVASAIVTQLAG